MKFVTYASTETEVSSDEGERDGDAEPEREDGDESEEGNGRTAVFRPQETVEKEDRSEENAAMTYSTYTLPNQNDEEVTTTKYEIKHFEKKKGRQTLDRGKP